jgi:hypothetical protein
MLAVTEATLRFIVGLGNPPLFNRHPEIEYLLRPGSYCQFGNQIFVNSMGMRSPEDATLPTRVGELRVLVLGDSIINGGGYIDDQDLATSKLTTLLRDRLGGNPVTVCNVSAGSWGPENLLGYCREVGTFGAKIAVLVLSDHDYNDVPAFAPLDLDHPTQQPVSAIGHGLSMIWWRIEQRFSAAPEEPTLNTLASVQELVQLLSDRDIAIIAVLHPSLAEIANGDGAGLSKLRECLRRMQVPIVSTRCLELPPHSAESLYRDGLHLSVYGQLQLAKLFERITIATLINRLVNLFCSDETRMNFGVDGSAR